MPQSIALYPGMTVREHLRLFGGLAGLRGRQLAASIDELVVALQLAEFVDRRLGLLSGGQQRRTQAATALLHRPGLLVLDEPTAGADPQTRQSLLAVVRDRARQGAAVVYVTHYLPELTELGATLAVARHGRVIARGAAAELLRGLPSVVTVASDRAERSVPTHDPTATLIDLLGREGGTVVSIEVRNPSLDDLYASLAVGAHD
jgi:ABC-2 type transport system ATP-binding protein